MYPKAVVCNIFIVLIFIILNTEATTYYFNVNKTNNGYMIYNRVNTNHSASINHYPSGVYIGELRNNVSRRRPFVSTVAVAQTHTLLDPDWNYNWTNITRSKLPSYIHKYFEATSRDMAGPIRILFNTIRQNSSFIRFNLSQVNVNESVSDIELHFYHSVEESLLQKSLILRLYLINGNDLNNSSLLNPDAHKLLNVIYILQADNAWQVFKLTNGLYDSLNQRQDLLLLITVSKPNEDQFTIFKDKNLGALRTFMTLEFESEKKNPQPKGNVIQGDSCRKLDLYIDFEKLNWMKFIVAPKGYHAFNCLGRCSRFDNLPNHIKITSYLPEINRKPLCCVPTDYSGLPIMFYDKNGNIVIKMYDNMIVSSCGCR